MTRQISESSPADTPAFSLKHLAVSTVVLGFVSFGAVLLNSNSWVSGSISVLWPSTGLLIGILLCLPRKQWPIYLLVGFSVDLIVNASIPPPTPVPGMLYLAACNVVEVLVAASLLKPTLSPQRSLSQPLQLARFLGFGVLLAPAIASLMASCYPSDSFALPTFHAFQHWFTADALGNSIVTPFYLSLQKRSPFSRRSWYEVTFLLACLCATSIAVFWQTSLPLLFVILPILLLVEVRLGLAGSAMGLLAVSVIGGYFTAIGRGPVSLTRFQSLSPRTLTLQFFTLVCMMVVYIMEVVLAERNRLELNLGASELRFRLLAEGSHDIIMLQDLQRDCQYVSPAVRGLLGWEPEEFLPLAGGKILHPADVQAVAQLYDVCAAGRALNTLDFRCKKKDGDYLWVEANLVLHHDPESGAPSGFINVLRDVSARKLAEEELNKALDAAASLASIDALTGVANRRSFDEFLESEWLRSIRAHSPISILMIDVDHFKLYNDRYGHVSGDACLREIARTIASCIHRPTDLLARYGGEEFVVVLPATDDVGARSKSEQIRSALEERQILHEGNSLGVVTISLGCATQIPAPRSLCTQLVKIADAALYQAKSAGRNCVRFLTEPITEANPPSPDPSLLIHLQ